MTLHTRIPPSPALSTTTAPHAGYSDAERQAYRTYRRWRGVDAVRAEKARKTWVYAKACDAAGIAADLQGRV